MAHDTPEKRARRAARVREWRKDPAVREHERNYRIKNRAKQLERARVYRAKPETRARRQLLLKKYRSQPEFQKSKNDKIEANLVSLAGRPRPECCEVCGRNKGGIHFDHCHKNGHFRGWLCRSCNWILGHADDNPNILRKLIAYLERTARLVPPQLTLPGI